MTKAEIMKITNLVDDEATLANDPCALIRLRDEYGLAMALEFDHLEEIPERDSREEKELMERIRGKFAGWAESQNGSLGVQARAAIESHMARQLRALRTAQAIAEKHPGGYAAEVERVGGALAAAEIQANAAAMHRAKHKLFKGVRHGR